MMIIIFSILGYLFIGSIVYIGISLIGNVYIFNSDFELLKPLCVLWPLALIGLMFVMISIGLDNLTNFIQIKINDRAEKK